MPAGYDAELSREEEEEAGSEEGDPETDGSMDESMEGIEKREVGKGGGEMERWEVWDGGQIGRKVWARGRNVDIKGMGKVILVECTGSSGGERWGADE